jgi:hypothetical protein
MKTWPGRPRARLPRRRVLIIDDWLPDPRIGAGAPRALQLIRAVMAAGWSTTLLPTTADPPRGATLALLPGLKIARGYGRDGIGRFLARRAAEFAVVIVSRPHNMRALRHATLGQGAAIDLSRVVYDAEAVFAERELIRRRLFDTPDSNDLRDIETETALVVGTRLVLAVSEATAKHFREAGHSDVRILGHAGKVCLSRKGFAQRDGFLFVGPTYEDTTPNADSLIWLCDHVLPLLGHELRRTATVVHAGEQRSNAVSARQSRGLRSLGVQSRLAPLYGAARVFVAPTRFAAGIPLKVYDAAAHGLPVVMTPLLAHQLGWENEREALIAESPQEFAMQCARLHEDQPLWERLRSTALRRVERDCDPQRFNRVVSQVLADATL